MLLLLLLLLLLLQRTHSDCTRRSTRNYKSFLLKLCGRQSPSKCSHEKWLYIFLHQEKLEQGVVLSISEILLFLRLHLLLFLPIATAVPARICKHSSPLPPSPPRGVLVPPTTRSSILSPNKAYVL